MSVAAVVMAGGRGERFWPSSREDRPKQFLALEGDRSLLQRTVDRLQGVCEPESTWVVTRADFADIVREQLPEVPEPQLLLEPEGRDTAPCIALASLFVAHKDPDAVMVVLPADHLILQEDRFREALQAGIRVARSTNCLVTLGIRPTRPETGYGYIQADALLEQMGEHEVYWVASFKEKPHREQAMLYLQQGGYYWNSGIFIWKVSAIRAALAEHLPAVMEALAPVETALGTDRVTEVLEQVYPTLPRISIDYGVMERAENVLVIPADFGWDDLGTWTALERVVPPDESGNVIAGRVLAVDTAASILKCEQPNRLLVAFGLNDVVVVDTADVVLVADKHRVPELKSVVGRLKELGYDRHLRLTDPESAAD